MYQLLSYDRLREHFEDHLRIPLSFGSLVNFNKDVFGKAAPSEAWVKRQLIQSLWFMPTKPASISVVNGIGCTVHLMTR